MNKKRRKLPQKQKYAGERRKLLAEGRFEAFMQRGYDSFEEQDRDRSIEYFSQPGRLEKIRQKLGMLQIIKDDFRVCFGSAVFTKVYLSNALGYDETLVYEDACAIAKRVAAGMAVGGLLYISDYKGLENARNYTGAFVRLNRKDNRPQELVLDSKLTLRARALEINPLWLPVIYRRVA